MRSLSHEIVVRRMWAQPEHESWQTVVVRTRRALLRRLLRQGDLRPAGAGRERSAHQQVPAQHDHPERQ
jgi:hypothetical protein